MDKQTVQDISNKHYLNALADQVSVVCMKNCSVLVNHSDQLSQQDQKCLCTLPSLNQNTVARTTADSSSTAPDQSISSTSLIIQYMQHIFLGFTHHSTDCPALQALLLSVQITVNNVQALKKTAHRQRYFLEAHWQNLEVEMTVEIQKEQQLLDLQILLRNDDLETAKQLAYLLSDLLGWDKLVKSQHYMDSTKVTAHMQNQETIVYLTAENKEKVVTDIQEVKVMHIPSMGNCLFVGGNLRASQKGYFTDQIIEQLLPKQGSNLKVLVVRGGHLVMVSRLLQNSRVDSIKIMEQDQQVTLMAQKWLFDQQDMKEGTKISYIYGPEQQSLKEEQGEYDCIMVDGMTINKECFQDLFKILLPGGCLSVNLSNDEACLNYTTMAQSSGLLHPTKNECLTPWLPHQNIFVTGYKQ